jgi:hypothetical protein
MCSNCCLTSLQNLGDITWPLYVGAASDNTIFSIDNIQNLIRDLSPNELERLYNSQYNRHRLSCVKFNQIKLNHKFLDDASNKIRTENPNISEGNLSEQRANEINKIMEVVINYVVDDLSDKSLLYGFTTQESIKVTKIVNELVFYTDNGVSADQTDDVSERVRISPNGNVGIGVVENATIRLDVGTGTGSSGAVNARYFNYGTTTVGSFTFTDVCARFGSTIWVQSWVAASSDKRIKEDIEDINDDSALNIILAIEPKKYKYIDKIAKGDKKVYGFIAQQIREVLPDAVNLQREYIPNIMLLADYNDKIITLSSRPSYIIKINDKIKCYDINIKNVYVEVIEIIDEITFRVKPLEYTDNKIFVYGVEIDDFHTISKEYIFTLNVCATQELHRRMESQNVIIKSQEERIKDLETKMAQILNNISQ